MPSQIYVLAVLNRETYLEWKLFNYILVDSNVLYMIFRNQFCFHLNLQESS